MSLPFYSLHSQHTKHTRWGRRVSDGRDGRFRRGCDAHWLSLTLMEHRLCSARKPICHRSHNAALRCSRYTSSIFEALSLCTTPNRPILTGLRISRCNSSLLTTIDSSDSVNVTTVTAADGVTTTDHDRRDNMMCAIEGISCVEGITWGLFASYAPACSNVLAPAHFNECVRMSKCYGRNILEHVGVCDVNKHVCSWTISLFKALNTMKSTGNSNRE